MGLLVVEFPVVTVVVAAAGALVNTIRDRLSRSTLVVVRTPSLSASAAKTKRLMLVRMGLIPSLLVSRPKAAVEGAGTALQVEPAVVEAGVEQPAVPAIPVARPLAREQAMPVDPVRQAVGQPQAAGVAVSVRWVARVLRLLAGLVVMASALSAGHLLL